jgi:FdhD protein
MNNPKDTGKKLSSAPIRFFKKGQWRDSEDTIAPEVRITLLWPVIEPVSLWAHPSDLEELALGYAAVEFCGEGQVPRIERIEDNAYYLEPLPGQVEIPAAPEISLDAEALVEAMRGMIESGGSWDATGAFHRAAIYDPRSRSFEMTVEDIGRHNCIDRLAGWAVSSQVDLRGKVLVITARATASLAAKASKAGYPAVVSRSAVTTAAVEAAEESGMTLIGFCREKEDRLSVFADPGGRIET